MCLCGHRAGVIVVAVVPFSWRSCTQANKAALSSPSVEVSEWQMSPPVSGKPILVSSELWHTGGGDLQKLPWCCLLVFSPQSLLVQGCRAFICYKIQTWRESFFLHRACSNCLWFSPLCDTVCPTGLLVWRYFLTYLWCFQNNLKLSVLAKPLQANWKTFVDTRASNTGTGHV